MTNHGDKNDPFNSDDDFENFLADLAGSAEVKKPAAPAAKPPEPTPAPAPAPLGVDRALDFDDDDDGATRVGQIPAELLLALGRKAPEEPQRPASDARPTDRPPAAEADETEVELDEFGDLALDRVESLAPPIGTHDAAPSRAAPPAPAPTTPPVSDRPTLGFDDPLTAPTKAPPSQSVPRPVVSLNEELARASARSGSIPPTDSPSAVARLRSLQLDDPLDSVPPTAPARAIVPRAAAPDHDDLEIEAGGDPVLLAADDDAEISVEAGGEEIILGGDDDDDDEISIDAGGDEVILDGDDDDVPAPRPAPVVARAVAAVAPRRVAPPILTLSGRDLLAARARMLATLAADAKGDALESAYLAAAELGERAKLPDTDTWLESAAAGSAVARRILARRGRRAVRSLTRDSLGADVAALDAMLDSVVLARSDEPPLASLERAIELAHSTQLKRLAAAAAADVASKAGDSTKAATLRLSTLGDDQPTSTTLAAARRLRALGSKSGTGTALAHASQRTPRPEVCNALARWSDLFSGAKTAPDDDGSLGALDTRLASDTQRESALLALAELGDADDRAHFMALAAERAVARGAIDTARARFDDARRLTSRSGFVDALRDAAAARVGDAASLPPTPVHDEGDAPIAAVGRACTLTEVSPESLLAVREVLDLPRAAATAARLLADIAANLGEPTEWVDALALERRAAPVGGPGIDVARALVFARAGDRDAAIDAVREAESGIAATARALLSVSRDPAAAARLLSPDATASHHDLALRTRLDRAASLDTFQHALAESPNDAFLALRLEQAARRDSNATAETEALSALARLADDETDRTKLRLLSSSAQQDENTLDLAPNDPILLAEALLGRTVAPAVRDRAVALLAAKAPAIVLATLHARSSTLLELDGSPADAAMQLRQAHEAVPNEPSMRVSLELAELAAGQSVRVAHRLFAAARSEADDPTRARAFARLADLDRHETGDGSAAMASLLAVNELAPLHVPTLRALEALGRDRSDTANAAAIETRLASALVPGRSSDAHARMAIRLVVAASASPSTDIRVVALNALARGTTSTRLLRWAEHAARTTADGREQLALEGRIASAADDAERVELLARIAAYAERRGDFERARVALDDAFERDPSHTAVAIERATLLDSSDENGSAALAHEAAAALCRTEAQAIVHLVRAAEHHEANGANDRARTVLESAHERSPGNPAILEALSGALERWADIPGALETLERRIELGGAASELLPAHRKRAALAERLGRTDVARVAYDDILAIEPVDGPVLQRAAELAIAAEDGRAAVDALIRLARIERDPAALVAIFRALGDAYERLAPDPRRAEASYRRVLQLEPADPIANQQLVGILNAQSRWPDSLTIVDAFDAAAPSSRLAQELRFSVARGLEASGDARQAEQLLEAVRKAAPTDAAIVLEMARFYERQGAKPALSMHLNRAAADLRRAFEEAPSRAPLEGLLEVHRLRARADAFACAAATAATLGVSHALQGQALRDHVDGAGKRANDAQVDEVVAPRSLPDGTRGVLRLAGEAIERAFPFDARPFKTEKLGKDAPIRVEALRAAELFGFDDVVVLVTAAAPRICVPVSAHPFTIVMGRELPVITSEREREFLFVRAAKIAASGLSFAMRLQGAQVAQAMFALVRAHDPNFAPPGVDIATLDEPARVIAKATSSQSALGALCFEMAARPSFEPHRFGIAAAEWSDRVALVATGQTHAGVSALLRLGGHDLDTATDFDTRLRVVRAMPEAFGLLAFSLSDAHAEARVRAGIARG